jgi:hypothetical protein
MDTPSVVECWSCGESRSRDNNTPGHAFPGFFSWRGASVHWGTNGLHCRRLKFCPPYISSNRVL